MDWTKSITTELNTGEREDRELEDDWEDEYDEEDRAPEIPQMEGTWESLDKLKVF